MAAILVLKSEPNRNPDALGLYKLLTNSHSRPSLPNKTTKSCLKDLWTIRKARFGSKLHNRKFCHLWANEVTKGKIISH